MITIIFGAPGSGKSSLNTYFLKELYRAQGKQLLEAACDRIERINQDRAIPLSCPDKPPIYADYAVKFKIGYEKWAEPYFINGYYLGLANDRMATLPVPPGSKIFLSEAQRYYDSRKSQTFPDHVSRAYEMHRHYGIDIWMDVQRVSLIDLNIRQICRRFIEVLRMEHKTDENGRILKTMFHCRTFGDWIAVDQYLTTGAKTYQEEVFVNEGNIFDCFNSFAYFDEFVPKEGADFRYLPFAGVNDQIREEDQKFYKFSEPEGYRVAKTGKKEKKESA